MHRDGKPCQPWAHPSLPLQSQYCSRDRVLPPLCRTVLPIVDRLELRFIPVIIPWSPYNNLGWQFLAVSIVQMKKMVAQSHTVPSRHGSRSWNSTRGLNDPQSL